MITFFRWYYIDQTKNLVSALRDIFSTISGYFAINAMIGHLFEPLYQDYTYSGRLIGFLIRVARILFGIFTQLIALVFFLVISLIWLILPALIIVKIIYILLTMW